MKFDPSSCRLWLWGCMSVVLQMSSRLSLSTALPQTEYSTLTDFLLFHLSPFIWPHLFLFLSSSPFYFSHSAPPTIISVLFIFIIGEIAQWLLHTVINSAITQHNQTQHSTHFSMGIDGTHRSHFVSTPLLDDILFSLRCHYVDHSRHAVTCEYSCSLSHGK